MSNLDFNNFLSSVGSIDERPTPNEGRLKVRYVKETMGGSTVNTGNHLVEIRALDKNGNNLALGKPVYDLTMTNKYTLATDGSTATNPYASPGNGYILDLEGYYDVTSLQIWHYHGDARTYKDLVVSVSADGERYFEIFSSAKNGLYTETAAGKTHQVPYLGLVEHYPFDVAGEPNTTTNNAGFTDYGYYLHETLTNMITPHDKGNFSLYNNHSAPITIEVLDETYMGHTIYRWKYIPSSDTLLTHIKGELWGQGICSKRITYAANTSFVRSIMWRPVTHTDVRVGGIASNIGGWTERPDYDMGDGWFKNEAYRVPVTTEKEDLAFISVQCPSAKLNEPVIVDMCCFQLHPGYHAPRYIFDGSLPDSSTKIPFTLKPPYTVNVFYTPDALNDNIVDQVSSPIMIQLGEYYGNSSISFWNYIRTIKAYIKSDDGTGWDRDITMIPMTANIWDHKEHMWTIVAKSSTQFEFYMDGVLIGSTTTSRVVNNINHINFVSRAGSAANSGKYRDLSIFNYDLSAIQIKALQGVSLKLDGTLEVDEFIDGPLIPEGAIHFPLSEDTYDTLRQGKAIKEPGIFVDGAAWAGKAPKNEFLNGDFANALVNWNFWGDPGVIGTHEFITDPEYTYSVGSKGSLKLSCASNSPKNYVAYQSPAYSGGYRSLRVILRMSDGSPVTDDKCYPTWNANNGTVPFNKWTSIERIGDSPWYICEVQGFSQSGANNLVGIFVNQGYAIYIDNAYLENRFKLSPSVFNSRVDTNIRFALNKEFYLNWASYWTIICSKKPVYADNLLTGYSVDSLGTNGIRGYDWFGKSRESDNLYHPNGPMTPAKYFDQWHTYAIRKNGSTMKYFFYNGEDYFTEEVTFSTTDTGYFIGADNGDLTLGGWADTNSENFAGSYYRDLIVLKRALSDNDIRNILKANISIVGGKVHAYNEFEEK